MYTTGSGMCQRRKVMEDMQLHRQQPQVHIRRSQRKSVTCITWTEGSRYGQQVTEVCYTSMWECNIEADRIWVSVFVLVHTTCLYMQCWCVIQSDTEYSVTAVSISNNSRLVSALHTPVGQPLPSQYLHMLLCSLHSRFSSDIISLCVCFLVTGNADDINIHSLSHSFIHCAFILFETTKR